jgi:thiamine biosynthesis lipoprotein
VAGHCMTADALTKVVRLAPAALPALLDHYDAQTVIVDANGARFRGRDWLQ